MRYVLLVALLCAPTAIYANNYQRAFDAGYGRGQQTCQVEKDKNWELRKRLRRAKIAADPDKYKTRPHKRREKYLGYKIPPQ